MIYLRLFYEFFKVGLFSVGGGLATLPFLSDIGEKTGWFTPLDLSTMIAVSESTPGPMGINMATYTGYTSAGVLGGVIASLGLVTPAIIIILIVSKILDKFKENQYVQSAFYGLRPASAALILIASLEVFKIAFLNASYMLNIKALIFGIILFFAINKFKSHPIVYIIASAIIGIIIKF